VLIVNDLTGNKRSNTPETCCSFLERVLKIYRAVLQRGGAAGFVVDTVTDFSRICALVAPRHHQLDQSLTATQLVNLCVEKEIEIPGLSLEKQADVDAGRKRMGTIMGRVFGAKTEIKVEDFRVTKSEETAHTGQGNLQQLKKYTFGLVPKAQPVVPADGPSNETGRTLSKHP
jgi:hypothetical protein